MLCVGAWLNNISGIETRNVVPLTTPATDPIASEGVVAAGVYVDGRRVANIAINEASSWRSKPGHVVWIGLYEPDLALLTSVQKQFDLHDLAIEDANNAHQRPKIEQTAKACSSWRGRRN
jgi:magnesium transporter